MAEFAKLILEADARQLKDAEAALARLDKAAVKTEARQTALARASAGMGKAMGLAAAAAGALAATLAATASVGKFISETVAMEKAQAQLAATIKSTGGAAGRSVAQLNAHAAALQRVTAFGDDAVTSAQALLMTFTQVRGEAFDKATEAALDLSTAMGGDLQGAILQVGKALNDPVRGMNALSRSGIQFTEAQKATVKAMVETNDLAGAQAVILKELETQFGGSAEAARNTLGGALTALGNAWGDLFELTGPGAVALREAIEGLIGTVNNPSFVAGVQAIGTAFFNTLTGAAAAVTFLVDNMGRIASYAAAAAAVMAGPYVVAAAAAVIGTASLSGALLVLRGALIRTGIGALIVGAGELIYQFLKLVERAGGFGKALNLLGNVARTVWQGIIDSAKAIPVALDGVWAAMRGGFLISLSKMTSAFQDFIFNISSALSSGGFDDAAAGLMRVWDAADGAGAAMMRSGAAAQGEAAGAFAEAGGIISAAFGPARDAVAALSGTVKEAATDVPEVTSGMKAMGNAAEEAGGKGAAGAKAAKEALDAAKKAAEEYAEAMRGTVTSAIDGAASAFGDWVSSGFKSFKDLTKGILDSFKQMISQMIALAIANPIKVALGLTGAGGAAGAAAGAVGGGGGGIGGALSGLLGSGGAVGGILSGLTGVLQQGGILGTLGQSFRAVGGLLSGSIGGLGAIGAAIPAIGAIALAASALIGKKTVTGQGVQGSIGGGGAELASYQDIQTKRLFGLIKSNKTKTNSQDASGLAAASASILSNVGAYGAALGLGNAGAGVRTSFIINTAGMSPEQAQEALTAELAKYGDAVADATLGTRAYSKEGETSLTTLERLVSSMTGVNAIMANLGHSFRAVGLSGAAAAANLADLFGSLENLQSATANFVAKFYSDTEKTVLAVNQAGGALAALGVVLPKTRDGYRDLIDAQDLNTDNGRRLYATLIGIADAMDLILPKSDAAAESLVDLADASLEYAKKHARTAFQYAEAEASQRNRAADAAQNPAHSPEVIAAIAAQAASAAAAPQVVAAQAAAEFVAAQADPAAEAMRYVVDQQAVRRSKAKLDSQGGTRNRQKYEEALRGVPAFASGGFHSGGVALVGERGPELINTGPARIHSADKTRDMLGSSSEIAAMREEMRQLMLQVARNTKRMADLAQKDDAIGTPPVRAA